MNAQSSKRILAGLSVLMLGSTSALAADAQAFANRVKAVAEAQGLPLAFSSAEADGENVVMKGVKLGTGPDAPPAFDVTFETVTGSDADGWEVARIPIADLDKTEDGTHVLMSGAEVTGLQIAGTSGASKLPGLGEFYFASASLDSVLVEEGGEEVFSLTGAELTNTETDGGGLTTEGDFGAFKADFTKGKTDETAKAIVDFGYPQISGTASFTSAWNAGSGELTLEPFNLSLENLGELDLTYQINGYTPAFISSLREIQKQMIADPEAAQSSGMAIIGLISQLSVASTEISYTDASFTNKLLDYYAKQNNISRDELVTGLTSQVPQMLAALQNPEFQTEVSTAVETFLKDPKSLSIAIEPDAPIAATQIIGAAMGAPQTLPQVLQLSVTANDPEASDDDAAQ